MEFIYLSSIVSFVFFLLAATIYKGYKNESKQKFIANNISKLSLIIAAKNEEQNINSLIDSLEIK